MHHRRCVDNGAGYGNAEIGYDEVVRMSRAHNGQWLADNNGGGFQVRDDAYDLQTIRNSILSTSQLQNQMYRPYSCIITTREEPHHFMYSEMISSCLSSPTPVPSNLLPLILLQPPLTHSHCLHHRSTMTQDPQLQLLLPPSPTSPPPLPQTSIIGSNTIQPHNQQHINYDNNENNKNGTTAVEIKTKDTSPLCFRRLNLEERTIATGMTSTVVFNNVSQNQKMSNNDATKTEPLEIKPTTDKQLSTTVNDDKVISVCQRTILAVTNKMIQNDYESALYKLRKTIRILEILMFNEDSIGIGCARVDTVRPWLKTLKDMAQRISLKQGHHNNNNAHDNGNSTVEMIESNNHHQSVGKNISKGSKRYNKNASVSNGSSNSDSEGKLSLVKRSNPKRYRRTTGKLIVKQG